MIDHTYRYESPNFEGQTEEALVADDPLDFEEEEDEWEGLSNKPWNLY